MITIENVSFKYHNSENGALHDVSLSVREGECVLLCGKSGCGKTTVTRLINGLIPHFYEGEYSGRVSVCKMSVQNEEIYNISKKVGSVFQNPRSQFFCLDTTSEVAFGCENLGLGINEIRERMKRAVSELEMGNLMDRDIFKLSGGEKQRIACGSVTAMQPDIFILDEPTSNLDMESIERLKQTLLLWKNHGKTIVIAEHRFYWLKEICDRVVYLDGGKIQFDISMKEFEHFPKQKMQKLGLRMMSQPCDINRKRQKYVVKESDILLRNYQFAYEKEPVLAIDDMPLPQNEIVAITGQNGAGKSTFVRCLCGLEKKFKGKTIIGGRAYCSKEMLRKCYLVMQDVNHQLFCETVEDEVLLGSSNEEKDRKEKAQQIMEKLGIWEFRDRHPMSLSGGQKQRVAIASAILTGKDILIFDEPTSGLDHCHMEQTAKLFRELREIGKSIFVITHDRELIDRCCMSELYLGHNKAVLHMLLF